jgi:hypothetical protein
MQEHVLHAMSFISKQVAHKQVDATGVSLVL